MTLFHLISGYFEVKTFSFFFLIFIEKMGLFDIQPLTIRIAGDIRHVEQVLVPLVVPNHVVVMRLFTADSFQDRLKMFSHGLFCEIR